MTPTEQRPQECKHLGDWWSCERTKEIVNGEEWTQTCDCYPHCSDCPDFTPKTEKMETNDDFNRIMEMNTETERRKIAAQIMASMMQNAKWGDKYSHIATMAVSAADALIAELNKKKDE